MHFSILLEEKPHDRYQHILESGNGNTPPGKTGRASPDQIPEDIRMGVRKFTVLFRVV
jgi:hypothetical protein